MIKVATITLIIFSAFFILVPYLTNNTVSATWWNSDYGRCKVITVTNAINNGAININVTYDSNMQTDFDDIRFTDIDNTTSLAYWIETKVNSSYARVWINLSADATTDNRIVMYYNKSSATSASNGYNTFKYFDDFDDSDMNEYTSSGQEAYYTISYPSSNALKLLRSSGSGTSKDMVWWSNYTFDPLNKIVIGREVSYYSNTYSSLNRVGMYNASHSGNACFTYYRKSTWNYAFTVNATATTWSSSANAGSYRVYSINNTLSKKVTVRAFTNYYDGALFGSGTDTTRVFKEASASIYFGGYTWNNNEYAQYDWMLLADTTSGGLLPSGTFGSEIEYVAPHVNTPPTITNPVPTNSTTNVARTGTKLYINVSDIDADAMTILVNCSNGDYTHVVGGYNQTVHVDLMPLAWGTTYRWWVNVSDGTVWVRKWYEFTAEINDPPTFGTPSPTNGSTGNNLALTWSIPISDDQGETFNWTIQCNNTQTNSGNGASNGTKSLSLSGLTHSHTYKIWVNATDIGSKTYTRKWYTFTTEANSIPTVTFPTFVNKTTGVSRAINNISFILTDGNGELMTCHGQSKSGDNLWLNSTGNGTKTFTFSMTYPPFPYSYNCTFWINVTDGYGWVNRSYWFLIEDNVPPAISDPLPANHSTNVQLYLYDWNCVISDPDETFDWYIEIFNSTASITNSHGYSESDGNKACLLWGGYDPYFDFNTDGIVDQNDADLMLVYFGETGNPPKWVPEDVQPYPTGDGDVDISDMSYFASHAHLQIKLEYDTNYTIFVNATDGYDWTNETYWFTTIHNYKPVLSDEYPINGSTGVSVCGQSVKINVSDQNGDGLDWTFESAYFVSVGYTYNATMEAFNVTFPFDTEVKVWVNVTDGTAWTREWFTFTTIENTPAVLMNEFPINKTTNAQPSSWDYGVDNVSVYISDPNIITEYDPLDIRLQTSINPSSAWSMTSDELYVYCGGFDVYKYWKSNMTFIGNTSGYGHPAYANYPIQAIDNDDNYIFIAGYSDTEHWNVYWKSNLTYKARPVGCLGTIWSITHDDTYVYLGGGDNENGDHIYKYWKSNFTKKTTLILSATVAKLLVDDTYLYYTDYDSVRQLWKSNLTQKSCLTFNDPYHTGGGFSMDDTYLYVANSTYEMGYCYNGSVSQYWKSNLTRKAQTPTIVHNNGFRAITAENQTYIYAGGWTSLWWYTHDGYTEDMMNPLIYQYWKSNMTLKQTSNNGSTGGTEWLCEDDDYVYGIAVSGSGVAQYYKNGSAENITYTNCYPIYWWITVDTGHSLAVATGWIYGNGTIYCPVVNSTFEDNVTWGVALFDGADWTNETYWFNVLDNIPPIIYNWQLPTNESEGVNISTANLRIVVNCPYQHYINYKFKLENVMIANVTNFHVNGQTYLYGNITGLLQPMKKYNWSIYVFDGIDWTNETYWFITQMIYIDFNWTIRSNGRTVDFYSKNATSTVLYYIWDFGDAGMSNAHNPRHTYAYGPANYTVKLKVQDNATLYTHTATHIIPIIVSTTVDNSIGKPLLNIDWTFILYLAVALLILLVVVLIVKGIGSMKKWMDKK